MVDTMHAARVLSADPSVPSVPSFVPRLGTKDECSCGERFNVITEVQSRNHRHLDLLDCCCKTSVQLSSLSFLTNRNDLKLKMINKSLERFSKQLEHQIIQIGFVIVIKKKKKRYDQNIIYLLF